MQMIRLRRSKFNTPSEFFISQNVVLISNFPSTQDLNLSLETNPFFQANSHLLTDTSNISQRKTHLRRTTHDTVTIWRDPNRKSSSPRTKLVYVRIKDAHGCLPPLLPSATRFPSHSVHSNSNRKSAPVARVTFATYSLCGSVVGARHAPG